MTRYRLLAGMACLAALAGPAPAQTPYDFAKIPVTAQRVADNFYVIDETAAHGGSVSILVGPDGILLVDAGVAGLAAKVEAEVRRLSPLPIRYLINTHSHIDETGGNPHFARTGVTMIGRDTTRRRMLNPPPPPASAANDGRAMRQARPIPPEAAPKLTFATEMGLHFNGQDIKVVAVPRAHTDNDAIIIFPKLDIVVVGDVLRAGEFPSIHRPDGGTLQGMLDGLATLIALGGPNTRFVTAHGQVVGREAVIAQRQMLVTSRDRIAAMIAQGKTVEQVIAAKVAEGLGAVAQPGHIGHDAFVRDVYNELKPPA